MARRESDAPAYHVRAADGWKETPWRTYVSEVRAAAKAMMALGLGPGGTVAILGFNRPEWTIFDLAAMCAGGAPAGIYTTCPAEDVRHICKNSGARLILVENAAQMEKVASVRADLAELAHIVMMRGGVGGMAWSDFLAAGNAVTDEALDARIAGLQDDQLATLVYTSGTTGFPKGVMLSHKNLSWTANCALALVDLRPLDYVLSYLPLSHIAEQMFTICIPVSVGGAVYFAESLEKVPDNLKEVQPTLFFGVPRIWEKFHAAISAKLASASGGKKKLLAWAQGVGAQWSAAKNEGKAPGTWLTMQYNVAAKLVFDKLKPAIGLGKARTCVSGAAPISKEVLEFFGSLDVRVHEVYGQSEDSGPTSFNVAGKNRWGTVGPAIPGIDVKIAEDGEILVRGPHVFMGYYQDPAATAETMDGDWLKTGDLGSFDGDGFLSITGRKKEILITAGGKNIAPIRIESALKNIPLVGEAVAIADRRKFVSAVLTLEPGAAERFAAANGVGIADLPANPVLNAELEKAIAAVNANLMQVEHVRKFTVLPRALTVEDGELTPSLKVKRRGVNKNWAREIDAMYEGAGG